MNPEHRNYSTRNVTVYMAKAKKIFQMWSAKMIKYRFLCGLEIEKVNVKKLQVANFKYAKMLWEESGLK